MGNPKTLIDRPEDMDIFFQSPYVTFSGYLKNEPNWQSRLHRHDCAEIILCTKGRGVVWIGGEKYTVEAGDLILYNPETAHRECCDEADPLEFFFLGVDGFVFPPLKQNMVCDCRPVQNAGKYRMQVELFFSELIAESMEQSAYYKAQLSLLASSILILVMRVCDISQQHMDRALWTSAQIKHFIDRHYTSPINLDAISESAYVSKYYISHIFKSSIGVSPIEYLINKRILHAKELLKHTQTPIAEIAKEVGYKDPRSFSQIFKRAVGVSPSKYRTMNMEELCRLKGK